MTEFEHVTTGEKVDAYNASNNVFDGLLKEMRELSKKKPDATLSQSKVTILNRVLDDLKAVLDGEPESKYLDLLADDELPQNSDAVLVMVQYERALVAFRSRYRKTSYGETYWITHEFVKELEEQMEDEDYDEDEYDFEEDG